MKKKISPGVTIKKATRRTMLVEVELPEGEDFLSEEEAIQAAVNAIGNEDDEVASPTV